MNGRTLRYIALCALVSAFTVGSAPALSLAADTGSGTLNGELVVISPAARTFRLVGYDNRHFVAPPGIVLDAFDGKPVIVQLGANGHVESIHQKEITYKPITHGITTIYGELQVVDTSEQRFRIQGESGTYVAPSGVNIAPYAGHRVKVEIGDSGQVLDLHLAAVGEAEAAPPH